MPNRTSSDNIQTFINYVADLLTFDLTRERFLIVSALKCTFRLVNVKPALLLVNITIINNNFFLNEPLDYLYVQI